MGAREELKALRAEFTEQSKPALSPREELEMLRAENLRLSQEEQSSFTGAGIIEPAMSLVSGMASMAGGGLAGIAQAANPFSDEGSGADIAQQVQEAGTYQPRTQAGKEGLQAVGGAMESVIDAVNYPLSGIGGLLELLSGQGIDQAMETLQGIQNNGLGKTIGKRALEETGSPLIATAGELLPEIATNLVGMGAGSKIGAKSRAKAAAKSEKMQSALDEIEKSINTGQVTEDGVKNVSEILQKGTPDEIAEMVKADPEFYRAADELGISTEPLAGFASLNPQFRDVEGALRKVPGSILDPQAIRFIEDTSKAADNLIEKYGGTIDKALLGDDFKRVSLENISDLGDQADTVYSMMKEIIPEGNRFESPHSVSFLKKLESNESISPKFRKILNDLSPKIKKIKGKEFRSAATGKVTDTSRTEVIQPTLARIDQTRREIGQAINKGSGPFKDVETGLNKALYARLTKDQDAIASSAQGGSDISDAAKGLVRQRKQLEDNLQSLLGKDLNKSLNVTVSGALKNLQKGEVDRFRDVMNAIPKSQRQGVVLSAMNDVFKGSGVNQTALSPTQFTKWYKTISRSPATKKLLFDNLPKESRKAVESLYKVSEGISRSLGQTIPTGRINALFDEKTGIIRRMVGKTVGPAVAIATGSPLASAATNATVNFLKQGNNGAKRAAELMGEAEFQNIIRQSVKEGVIDGGQVSAGLLNAQKRLEKSKKYQKWAEKLTKSDRDKLAGGLISFLFSDDEE